MQDMEFHILKKKKKKCSLKLQAWLVAKKCLLYYMAWEAVVVVLLFLHATVMAGCPKCSLENW